MRLKILLLSFALCFSSLAHSEKYTYCNNERDYKVHMEFHRMRVVMLAVFVFYSDLPQFKGVDERTLVEYISTQHDVSKLDPSSLIAKRLMHFYGVPYNKRDDENKEELRNLVSYINKTDEQRRAKYFKAKKITNQKVMDLYVALETIADLLDRSYDPVAAEEFGKKMYPASESSKIATNHLLVVKKFEQEGQKRYEQVTKGFEYPIDTSGLSDCLVFLSKARMKMRIETLRFQFGM